MASQGGTMQSCFYKEHGSERSAVHAPRVFASPNDLVEEGPKLCAYISPDPSKQDLEYVAQMGVTHCFTWLQHLEGWTSERINALRQRTGQHGLTLNNVGCLELGKSSAIILGTEDREREIECFQAFIAMLAEAGVHVTTFTWEAEGLVYSTGKAVVRGGALGRFVDAEALATLPCSERAHDSVSENSLWENMTYFLHRILPVCEKHHVRLLLHPNDPPLPSVCGLPCIMRSQNAFDRVFALAKQSPWLGMEFCCGTWMEGLIVDQHGQKPGGAQDGGDQRDRANAGSQDAARSRADGAPLPKRGKLSAGEDASGSGRGAPADDKGREFRGEFGRGCEALLAALGAFVRRDKVGVVHLRNTTAPLPCFAETFVDDGFVDVCAVARVLIQAGYKGTVILDHTPSFSGPKGDRCATSFSIGYIKAALRAAQALCH